MSIPILIPFLYTFDYIFYTMDLSKRIVLLKASVKEGEYPAFTPEDMIFLFEEVTHPESVVLNHTDPTECYVLFPPLVQLDEIYNLKQGSFMGRGIHGFVNKTTTIKCIKYCEKVSGKQTSGRGEKYEILPIKPEGRGAESPQPHSTPKGKLSQ